MVAALLALLIPLRTLTSARSAGPVVSPAAAPAPVMVRLQLASTVVPFSFSVSHLGRVVWRGEASASPVEAEVKLPFPAEGIDLALDAKWPTEQTAAIKLDVARGDEDPAAQIAWGDGAVSEVFTFR